MATFSKENYSPGLIHRPANDMYQGDTSLLKRCLIKEEIFPKLSCSLAATRDWREQEEQASIKCDRLCKTEENRSGCRSPEFLLNGQNSGDFDATEGRNEICEKDGGPPVNPGNDAMTAITCVYCNAVFANKSSLELHMRKLHDGKKVYDCSVCEKQFSHRSSRNIHLRVHTGQRPYECEICKKRFRVSSHLRDHVRTHTGERPFKCVLCGRGFKQSSDMKKHRKTHYKTAIADGGNKVNYPTKEKDKELATSYMIVRPNEVAAEHDHNPKGLRSPTDRPNNLKLVIKMERKLKDQNAISPLSCDSGVKIESDNSTSPENVPREKQFHYQEPAKHTSAVPSAAWPTPSGMFGKRTLSNGLTFQEHEAMPSSVPNFFQPFGTNGGNYQLENGSDKSRNENNQEKETNGVKLLNVQYFEKNHVRNPPSTQTHNGEVTPQSNVRGRTYADGGPTHDDDRRTYTDDRPTYTDDRPTYVDDRPTFAEDRPTYNDNRPTYTDDRPTHTDDRPTNTNDRPTYTDDRPTYNEDRSTYTNDKSTNTNDRPTNTNDRSTNNNDRPTNTNDRLTNTNDTPTNTNDRPTTYTDDRPTNTNDRPTNTNDKPTTYTNDRPTYTDDRATNTNDRPTYTDDRPTYTDDRPTNTNDRPTYTDDRPTYTDDRPTYTDDRPTYTDDRPTYTDDRPTYTNDRPMYTDDTPTMAYNGDIPTGVHSEQTNFSNFRQLESTEITVLTEPSGTVVAGQQTDESTTHEERETGNMNIQNGIQPMDVETATIPEGVDIANTSEHAVNGCAVDVVRSAVVVNLRNDNNSLKRTAIVPMRKQVQPTKKADREGNVQCATCLKRFRTVEVFSAHTCNDDSKSFKCNVCSKMFARATLLRQHMVLHQGSKRFKFKCNYCGRAFRHRSHLRDHERIHTGERPFKCSFCPKAFKQSSDLRKHENLHTGATRYRCEKCALDFKRCDALRKHAMLHPDGEVKVIKCEKCLSFFATPEGSAHTCQNKNRYRCQLCVQRFSNAASLRLHCHQDHTDQSNKTCLKCEFCKLELQSLDELEVHLATHQLLKTHQCNHCDQRFSLISQLEEHGKLHAQNSTQAPDDPFLVPTHPTANQIEQFYEEAESTNQRTEESTHAHFSEDEHNIVEVNTAAVPSVPVHSSSNKPAQQKYNFVPSTYQSLVRSTAIHATYMNDSKLRYIPRFIKPKPIPNQEYDQLRGRNDVGGDITRADPMNGDKRRTFSDGTENFGSRSDVLGETARVNPITGDTRRSLSDGTENFGSRNDVAGETAPVFPITGDARRSLSENDVVGESARVNPMTGDKRRQSERTENLGIRTDLPGETSRVNPIIGDKRRSSSDRAEYFGNRNDVAGETVRVNPTPDDKRRSSSDRAEYFGNRNDIAGETVRVNAMIGDKRRPSSDRAENLGNRNDIAGEAVRVNPTPDDKRRLSDRSDERMTYGDKGIEMEENNAEKHFSKSLYHQEAKRKYTCLNCRLEFQKESTLVGHVCDLRSETLYQCLVCEKEFLCYEDLQGHMRIHWKPVVYFKCTLCGERVRNEELLKEHNLKHLCGLEEPGNDEPPGRPWTPDEQPRAFRNGERTTNLDTITLTSGSVMATTVASYSTPVITSVSSDNGFFSKTTNRVQPRPSPPERGGFTEHRPSKMVVEATSPLTSPNQTAGNRERGLTTARSQRDKSSPGSVRTPYMTYFESTKSVPGAYLNVFGQGSTMVVSAMHRAMDASGGYPMYYWSRGSDNHGS